jgi:hypothetical protein
MTTTGEPQPETSLDEAMHKRVENAAEREDRGLGTSIADTDYLPANVVPMTSGEEYDPLDVVTDDFDDK